MKKEKQLIFGIIIGAPITLLILDLIGIRNLVPFTDNYDWLSFIGSCLSAFGSLTLGLLAMKQNESLTNLNKKMQEDNRTVNCYSIIDLMENHYIDYREMGFIDYYGSILSKKDETKDKKNYQRFIFHIYDKNEIPLKYIKFKKIIIETDFTDASIHRNEREKHIYCSTSEEYTELELSPKDNNAYYAPVYITNEIDLIRKFNSSNKLRITVESTIINSFNVAIDCEIVLSIGKTSDIHGDWRKYNLLIRKIYYKDVYVCNFNDTTKIVKHDY